MLGLLTTIGWTEPILSAKEKAYVPVSEGGEGRSVTDWPTGVTKYIPKKAYQGYTLWTSLGGNGHVYLMDMLGNIVHTWKTRIPPGLYGELLENGNLLYSGRSTIGYGSDKNHHMSGKGGVLLEKDWDDKTIARVEQDNAHHDQDKMPNGNYLMILWEPVPKEFRSKIPGGMEGTEFEDGEIFEELIVEVTPENKVVWSWRGSEHLDPTEYPICPLEDRLEWLHANAVDYLPADNPITGTESVMISLRHPSSAIIIEKATGKVQWRYGGCIKGEWGRLGAQHDFQMIRKDLPGYGNLLVFDNGMHLPSVPESGSYWGFAHSRVIEIDAKTKKTVWRYVYEDKSWKFPIGKEFMFNAPYISGAQRLPNGNTLICEGATGRIFEVTKKKEIVWEFVNPENRAIFRAYRYGEDFSGFKDKQLPPHN